MFEHMKNYKMFMSKISLGLRALPCPAFEESFFSVHTFRYRTTSYHFEENEGWMVPNFFSGIPIQNVI